MTITHLRLTEKITLLVLGIALFVGVTIASVGDWTLRRVGTDLKQARLSHINTAQISATDSVTPVVRADGRVVGMLVVRGGADEPTIIKASTGGAPLAGKDVMFISAASMSADEAIAPIDQMRSTLLGATAVIMVLAAMFGLIVARSVTDPLARLTTDVKRLAKGDTNLKFGDTARKDEIGEISRALETVRNSIVEMGRAKQSANQTQMFSGLGLDSALNSALDNLSRSFFDFGRGILRALEFVTGEFLSAGREVSKTDVFKTWKGVLTGQPTRA